MFTTLSGPIIFEVPITFKNRSDVTSQIKNHGGLVTSKNDINAYLVINPHDITTQKYFSNRTINYNYIYDCVKEKKLLDIDKYKCKDPSVPFKGFNNNNNDEDEKSIDTQQVDNNTTNSNITTTSNNVSTNNNVAASRNTSNSPNFSFPKSQFVVPSRVIPNFTTKSRMKYDDDDNLKMAIFILRNPEYTETGKSLWKLAQEFGVTEHSWSSMTTHWNDLSNVNREIWRNKAKKFLVEYPNGYQQQVDEIEDSQAVSQQSAKKAKISSTGSSAPPLLIEVSNKANDSSNSSKDLHQSSSLVPNNSAKRSIDDDMPILSSPNARIANVDKILKEKVHKNRTQVAKENIQPNILSSPNLSKKALEEDLEMPDIDVPSDNEIIDHAPDKWSLPVKSLQKIENDDLQLLDLEDADDFKKSDIMEKVIFNLAYEVDFGCTPVLAHWALKSHSGLYFRAKRHLDLMFLLKSLKDPNEMNNDLFQELLLFQKLAWTNEEDATVQLKRPKKLLNKNFEECEFRLRYLTGEIPDEETVNKLSEVTLK